MFEQGVGLGLAVVLHFPGHCTQHGFHKISNKGFRGLWGMFHNQRPFRQFLLLTHHIQVDAGHGTGQAGLVVVQIGIRSCELGHKEEANTSPGAR